MTRSPRYKSLFPLTSDEREYLSIEKERFIFSYEQGKAFSTLA